MAKSVKRYISELLPIYEDLTKKTYTEMTLDFDITVSNLYLYRMGAGNPTAETIDKIIEGVELYCPEAFKKMK